MGPNPVKLTEELLTAASISKGSRVLDLGSGQGITSVFLAKEYGLIVTAADLWSDPAENTGKAPASVCKTRRPGFNLRSGNEKGLS